MRHGLVVSGLFAILVALGCGGAGRAARSGAMPQGGTFTGVWYSPQYGEMHLVQTGTSVAGRYEKGERRGRIQGRVEGDILHFEWKEKREMVIGRPSETRGGGYFRIVKDERDDVFKILGQWGHDDKETGGGAWNAVKSKKEQPTLVPSKGQQASPSQSAPAPSGADGTEDVSPAVEDALGDI